MQRQQVDGGESAAVLAPQRQRAVQRFQRGGGGNACGKKLLQKPLEVNRQLGRINEEEAIIYTNLLDNMLEEIQELPKKNPDLLVYLKGSFETFKNRIENRGRSFEALDEETEAYFYKLWEGYDSWVTNSYKASPIVIIDIDKYDYVNSIEDKEEVLNIVKNKLIELKLI